MTAAKLDVLSTSYDTGFITTTSGPSAVVLPVLAVPDIDGALRVQTRVVATDSMNREIAAWDKSATFRAVGGVFTMLEDTVHVSRAKRGHDMVLDTDGSQVTLTLSGISTAATWTGFVTIKAAWAM